MGSKKNLVKNGRFLESDSTFTRLSEMRRELTQKNMIFDEKDRLLELKPKLER